MSHVERVLNSAGHQSFSFHSTFEDEIIKYFFNLPPIHCPLIKLFCDVSHSSGKYSKIPPGTVSTSEKYSQLDLFFYFSNTRISFRFQPHFPNKSPVVLNRYEQIPHMFVLGTLFTLQACGSVMEKHCYLIVRLEKFQIEIHSSKCEYVFLVSDKQVTHKMAFTAYILKNFQIARTFEFSFQNFTLDCGP